MRREVTELKNAQESVRLGLSDVRRSLTRTIRRIDANPLRMMHQAANNNTRAHQDPMSPQRLQRDDACDRNAKLAPTLRTLEQLWLEWTHGIGGNKACQVLYKG